MVEPIRIKCLLFSCLAGLSALLTLRNGADFGLLCTCGLSMLGGLYALVNLLEVPVARINFLLVSAVVITLSSASGVLFGYVVSAGIADDFWYTTLSSVPATSADLALAQVYTNVFAACLWLLGRRIHQSGLVHQLYRDVRLCLHTYTPVVLTLVGLILGSQVYLVNGRIIVYGGNAIAREGEPTHPLLALVAPLAPLLPFVLAYYAKRVFADGRWVVGLLFVAGLVGEMGWFFLFGRRSVVYFFVMLATGLTYEQVLTGRYIRRHMVSIGLAVLLMLTVVDTYHKLRTQYGFETLQRMNLMEGLGGLQTADTGHYASLRAVNMALRSVYSSLALGQFVNLFRTTGREPLAGRVLKNSLLLATPSNFLVDKKTIPAKEALYEQAFALSLTDISETLCLESFIDFGWYGGGLYAGLLFMLFYSLYRLACQRANPLFALLLTSVSVSLALSMVETDMITFLASIRNLAVYYVVTRLAVRPKSDCA